MSEWTNPKPWLLTWKDYRIERSSGHGALILTCEKRPRWAPFGHLNELKERAGDDWAERIALGEVVEGTQKGGKGE